MIDREERRSEAVPRVVRRRVIRRGPAGGRPAPGRGRPAPAPGADAALAGEEFGSAMWGDAAPSGDAVRSTGTSGDAVPPGDGDSPDGSGSPTGADDTGGLRAPWGQSGSIGADAYVGDEDNLGADAYLDDDTHDDRDGDADPDEPARAASGRATVTIPRQRPRPHRRVRPAPGGAPGSATGSRATVAGTGSRAAVAATGRAKAIAAKAASGASDEDAEPRPGTASEPPAPRWRLLAGGLVVLLVAGLVATGLLARSWYDQRQLEDARDGALAAARQTTVNFVSISAATVDRDLKRISDGAAGQFKDQFTQDIAQVRATVVANKVDSHGEILRAAVVSANLHSAVVLVAIDETVKNSAAPNGRLSHYRIQVNLSRGASGRWLVSQLQFVG